MTTTRKQHSPQFKARVVIRGDPRREDAQPVGVAVQGASHPDAKWRKAALEQMPELFVDGRNVNRAAARRTATPSMKKSAG